MLHLVIHAEYSVLRTPLCTDHSVAHFPQDVMDDDDDEDLDLFGDLSPEEKAAKEEHAKLVAKRKAISAEKAKLSKSLIIMDVKPWDDETGGQAVWGLAPDTRACLLY